MSMRFYIISAFLFALSACGTVIKKDEAKDKTVDKIAQGNLNISQKAYQKANIKMHAGMGVIDKDADIAFIQGMIPHHEGAVDMAKIILEHGDDEQAKTLARDIIKAQEEEITWMKNWLKERGLKAPPEAEIDHNITDHSTMNH